MKMARKVVAAPARWQDKFIKILYVKKIITISMSIKIRGVLWRSIRSTIRFPIIGPKFAVLFMRQFVMVIAPYMKENMKLMLGNAQKFS